MISAKAAHGATVLRGSVELAVEAMAVQACHNEWHTSYLETGPFQLCSIRTATQHSVPGFTP